MYDRVQIKERAKTAFKANYWKCVIVGIIIGILDGVLLGSGGSGVSSSVTNATGGTDTISQIMEGIASSDPQVLAVIFGAIAAALMIISIIGAALKIFVLNPFRIGGNGFFVKNSDAPAEVGEVLGGFRSPAYMRNVGGMLLRDLFIAIGTLVFIIPGIIFKYGFRLVPYIMAEYPELGAMEVLKLSHQKMKGYKWKAFVLDLSFIGWELLNVCTCGLLGLFYVRPYKEQARAEFYRTVRELTR